MGYTNIIDHIIRMDIAKPPYDKSDYSVLSMICNKCKTIVHHETFKGEVPFFDTPKICLNCGIIFKNGLILK